MEVTSLLVTGQSLGREEMTAMELIDHAEEVAAKEAAREAARDTGGNEDEEDADRNEKAHAKPVSSDDDEDEDEESDEYVLMLTPLSRNVYSFLRY